MRVDQLAGSKHLRSFVIERAMRSYFRQHDSALIELRDLELINEAADQLNFEVADVLEYASDFLE